MPKLKVGICRLAYKLLVDIVFQHLLVYYLIILFKVSVNGDYDFQIVKKDTQEPIDINVTPQDGNLYKIEFHPSAVTKYTLKANQKGSNNCKKETFLEQQRSM
jgi:hypothetical protein